MAITPVLRYSEPRSINDFTSGSVSSSSFTPSNNSLLVVIAHLQRYNTEAYTVTPSGGSLTYTNRINQVAASGSHAHIVMAWTAPVTTGASMSVSLAYSADFYPNLGFQIFEATGHDAADPLGAIVSAAAVATRSGSYSLSLGTTTASDSLVLAFANTEDFGAGLGSITEGTSWTELDNDIQDWLEFNAQYRIAALSSAAWNGLVSDYSWAAGAIEIKADSGGTPATANPTGVSATGSVGTLTVVGAASSSITGASATGAVGSLDASVSISAALSGVAATATAGAFSATIATSAVLSGVGATGAAGTLSITGAAAVALTGSQATAAAGTLAATIAGSAVLSGASGTGSTGTLTATGTAVAALAGVAAVAAVGPLVADTADSATSGLTGVAGVGSAGNLSVTGDAAAAIAGVAGTGQVGTPAASVASAAALSGVAGTSGVGSIAAIGHAVLALSGVAATGFAGSLTGTGDATGVDCDLTGVGGSGQCGDLGVRIGEIYSSIPGPPAQLVGARILRKKNSDDPQTEVAASPKRPRSDNDKRAAREAQRTVANAARRERAAQIIANLQREANARSQMQDDDEAAELLLLDW